jgi:hypothetical protein
MFSLPSAAGAETRRVCARSAIVRDTPGGFAIARLYRRDRVRIAGRSARRGWSPIVLTGGLPGWMLTRSLCHG